MAARLPFQNVNDIPSGYEPTLEELARYWWAANGPASSGEGDAELAKLYERVRKLFQKKHGKIVQEWWSQRAPGGILITEQLGYRARIVRRLAPSTTRSWELHRSTDLVTDGFDEVGAALREGDNLALLASEVLHGSPERILIGRLFAHASTLLGLICPGVEASAPDPKARLAPAVARYDTQIQACKGYYNVTAVRSAQFDYFRGVGRGVLGVGFVVGIAVAIAFLLLDHSGIGIPAETYAGLVGAAIAGALGSCVSVMWRMSTGAFVSDYEAGPDHLLMIGRFRPWIGAIFGLGIYFAVQANVFSLGSDNPNFYLLTFLAFIGGFSERFAPDVFGRVETKDEKHDEQPQRASTTDQAGARISAANGSVAGVEIPEAPALPAQ